MKINQTKEGVVLEVYVKPKSKEFRITVEGDEIVVYCTKEPVRGKVNKELTKEFSRLFHKNIEIVSGSTSKQKRLLVKGAETDKIKHALLQK